MKKGKKCLVRKSIITQLLIRCVVVITCTVLFTWLVDIIFIQKYYVRNKLEHYHDVYNLIERYRGSLSENNEEFINIIDSLCGIYNIEYLIVKVDGSEFSGGEDVDGATLCRKKLDQIVANMWEKTPKTLEDGDEYQIVILKGFDDMQEYIVMVGELSDGSQYIFMSALDGVRDSISTFRIFLFWSILANIIIACIPIVIFARGLSKPIKRLSDISKKMADLDFTAKYEPENMSEIDALGENLNQLSEKLESTICKLQGANAQLSEDMEQQTKADIVRKEFVANVSHELKTPIALISGYAEGLKESINDDDESRDFYCDVIMDEAGKMNRMVKELINLSYFESGGYFPEYSHFNINEMLRNSINAKEILVKNKNANVSTELIYEKKDMFVWADEYLIEEVFSNYYTNALNHVSDGGKIIVKTMIDGCDIRVSVYNTGEKIPDDAMDSVWDKFYKVDKARSREYGGSGIGLSIVKAVMEAHKGDYGVRNVDGGVEFWFSLLSKCDIELE